MIRTALAALALAACQFSRPVEELHPSLQHLPASADESLEARRDALAATVQQDLGCSQVELVLALDRRYANSNAVRYVVEACGTRATYAETCETYPQCRYLLLATVPAQHVVPLPSAPARPAPAPVSSAPALLDLALDAGTPPRFL